MLFSPAPSSLESRLPHSPRLPPPHLFSLAQVRHREPVRPGAPFPFRIPSPLPPALLHLPTPPAPSSHLTRAPVTGSCSQLLCRPSIASNEEGLHKATRPRGERSNASCLLTSSSSFSNSPPTPISLAPPSQHPVHSVAQAEHRKQWRRGEPMLGRRGVGRILLNPSFRFSLLHLP